MAAKKASSSPKRRKSTKPAPADVVPQQMALNEPERLRLRAYMAEFRRYNAEASLRLLEKQAYLRQLDPDNKLAVLDQAIRGVSESAAKAQQQYNETLAGVEKRLGISIKDFSFDDETGLLWPHNAAPTKE